MYGYCSAGVQLGVTMKARVIHEGCETCRCLVLAFVVCSRQLQTGVDVCHCRGDDGDGLRAEHSVRVLRMAHYTLW